MSKKKVSVGRKAIMALAKPGAGTAKTVISFLLDETGSMRSCLEATVGGFNDFLKALQDAERKYGGVAFSLTKFNSDKTDIVHSAVPVAAVVPLDKNNYSPAANTPLFDAIGKTIGDLDRALASEKDKVNVLVVILTDGEENSSKEFTRESIFKLIEARKKLGWTFVFLGADQDAYSAASKMGVGRGHTQSYSSRDTRVMYHHLANVTTRHIRDGFKDAQHGFFTDETPKPKGKPRT